MGSLTAAENFMRVRKKRPSNRDRPARKKIEANAKSELSLHSTTCPAIITAVNVQTPKTRFRRAKYRPLKRSGTISEIADDQTTLARLLAQVAMTKVPIKTAARLSSLNHG